MEKYPLLDSINRIEDVKRLSCEELPLLAAELRQKMIETVSKNGGHLASSLGVVEITIAMHRAFSSPEDKIIFDVGHQSYAHKLLTGRRDAFTTLRKKDGISGFPKREESEHDAFNTGHASTSVSAALGYARAMQLKGEAGVAVALIGDGAMGGGLALEAMNDAGQSGVPLIVILNDNDMSIAPNVGAIHSNLTKVRMSRSYVRFKRSLVRMLDTGKIGKWLYRRMDGFKNRIRNFLLPHLLFEEMGFDHFGPIDGHDITSLVRAFKRAKALRSPVVIHVVTKKGNGYPHAELDPEKFHGIGNFDIETGHTAPRRQKSNSAVFGDTLCSLAEKNQNIVAITAAMPSGTGLTDFAKRYPDRFFDVGIAEEHALTMAAGMAAGGLRPVAAIYSSFLQRAYDQLLHDICLQKLPVVIGVDRAGLVGDDGETHQGVYDVAFLTAMPGMCVYSPSSQTELSAMLALALSREEPAAIRYSRGSLADVPLHTPVAFGKWEIVRPIAPVTIVATGSMVEMAGKVAEEYGTGFVNARFLSPMDTAVLADLRASCKHIITVEDSVISFGHRVALETEPVRVTRLGVPNRPVVQASVEEQRKMCGMSREDLIRAVQEEL